MTNLRAMGKYRWIQQITYPPPAEEELAPDGLPVVLPNGFTRRQIAAAISPRIQELILLPTEKCNFRCTYCYEDFELGKMSEETQRAIELFIDNRMEGLELLKFSWFGGEPLVAKDVVLRLSRYAKQKCDEHGVKFQGGLTTNAYVLDQELARELISLNQDFFQITLDGWKEAHDVLRQRADGRGTFDVIWNNLLGLKALDLKFEVCVRVHVRRDNIENLEILMREFALAFQGDRRFYLDFQHLRDMGGEGGKSIENPVSYIELRYIEAPLRASYRRALQELRGVSHNPSSVEDSTTTDEPLILEKASNSGESAGSQRASEQVAGEPYICYAGKPNSLLIRSNGRIGKCTVAFDDDRNDVGYLNLDGSVVINNEKYQHWIRGLGTLESEITGCPIKSMPSEKSKFIIPIFKTTL
jgi:uncharacterized protein